MPDKTQVLKAAKHFGSLTQSAVGDIGKAMPKNLAVNFLGIALTDRHNRSGATYKAAVDVAASDRQRSEGESPLGQNILVVVDPAIQYPLFAGLVGPLLLVSCWWPTWSGESGGLGAPWAGHRPGVGDATFIIAYANPGSSQSADAVDEHLDMGKVQQGAGSSRCLTSFATLRLVTYCPQADCWHTRLAPGDSALIIRTAEVLW